MKAHEYNDTEVRLRMVENAVVRIEKRFDAIDEKFNRVDERFKEVNNEIKEIRREAIINFRWVIGIILTTNVLPLILHAAKLI